MKKLGWMAGILVGGLVLLLGMIYGYGTLLPQDHTATVEVQIKASPAMVEARVRDWKNTFTWKPGVTTKALPEVKGHLRYQECSDECLVIQVESAAGVYMTRIVENTDFGGTWTWRFHPITGGTRLVLTEDGEVYNPIFRVVMKHVFGTDSNIRSTADSLASSFESHL